MSSNVCVTCQKSFNTAKGLAIHKAKCIITVCEMCNKTFNLKASLKDHLESQQHQDRQKIFDLTLLLESEKEKCIEYKEKYEKCIEQDSKYNEIKEKCIEYKEKYEKCIEQESKYNEIKEKATEYKEKYEKCNQEKTFYQRQIVELKDEISDLKHERESFIKQLFEMKSTPSIYHNNTHNYNQSNSSTKISNICNMNKPPLNNEFLSKLKNMNFIDNVFADEQDICRWTLKQGLNNYILVLDKSRKVLSFTDEKGNTVRDQDGIKLASQLYTELGQNLEAVKTQLETMQDDPNEIFVPTTLDKRKKIVDNIITKNPHSMERFGKAYFKEYAKFDQLENKTQPQALLETEEKNTYDEPLDISYENFENFKTVVRNKFFQYEFIPLNYDLHQIGAFLNQFSQELGIVEKGGDEENEFYEWIKILDDRGKAVVFEATELLNLLTDAFGEDDIAAIIQYSKSSIYAKNAQLFISMFINRKTIHNFEAIKRDIFQGLAGPK